jgi:hypothetical protein
MTGVLQPSATARFEDFVMPATVGTSTTPNVIGGASVLISQANGAVGVMPTTFGGYSGANHSGTFTNTSDVQAKNIRVALPGATMPMVTELSNTLDGVVDSCGSYSLLFTRLFALLEAVAHGWGLAAVPAGAPNNPLSGGNIFWNPAVPAQHQNWINRVVGGVGSQVDPLCMFRHKGGIPITEGIANALYLACQPYCGVTPALRAAGRPGVAGRCVDGITLAVYGTGNLPGVGAAVPTLANVKQAIRYLQRCTGDAVGFKNGFEIWAKRVEFAGPELSLLPTNLNERFRHNETANFCRIWAIIFRCLYIRKSLENDPVAWGRDNANFDFGNLELQGLVDALLVQLQARNPAVIRADIESNQTWRRINGANWLNAAPEIYTKWVWGYGGHRNPLDFERASTTETWIDLGRDVGVGGEYNFTALLDLVIGHGVVFPADRIPQRNLLMGDFAMPADGIYGRHVYPICSGIPAFMGTADAAQFKAHGAEGVSKIISVNDPSQLLSRMYFPAVALRAACNQASHMQNNSRFAASMAMGIVDTGNAVFDDVYSAYVASGQVVDTTELVQTHIDLVRGILGWKDETSKFSIENYGNSIWTSSARNRFVKEVCFHPFVDSLVLGVTSTIGGLINSQSMTLTQLLQTTRGALATMPLDDSITRNDAVGLSAWAMAIAGQTVLWQRRLQMYDEDNRLTETSTLDVIRHSVRISDGFYGLPRVDSVYHWYHADGLDAVWTAADSEATSPPVARIIYTAGGAYRSLFEDGTANVTRVDFGGGELQLMVGGNLVNYRRIFVGGGGQWAYRTATPNFNPAAFVAVSATGIINDIGAIAGLPGKYLNCKSTSRSLVSGLNVPARPASGFDIMLSSWKGLGSLASKLSLFGLTQIQQKATAAKPDGGSSGGTAPTAASTVSLKDGDSVSTLTKESGLESEDKK